MQGQCSRKEECVVIHCVTEPCDPPKCVNRMKEERKAAKKRRREEKQRRRRARKEQKKS